MMFIFSFMFIYICYVFRLIELGVIMDCIFEDFFGKNFKYVYLMFL